MYLLKINSGSRLSGKTKGFQTEIETILERTLKGKKICERNIRYADTDGDVTSANHIFILHDLKSELYNVAVDKALDIVRNSMPNSGLLSTNELKIPKYSIEICPCTTSILYHDRIQNMNIRVYIVNISHISEKLISITDKIEHTIRTLRNMDVIQHDDTQAYNSVHVYFDDVAPALVSEEDITAKIKEFSVSNINVSINKISD